MSDTSATHETYDRDEEIKTSSDRSFGVVFTIVFILIGLWPLTGSNDPRWWLLIAAALLLAISFIYPSLLAPGNRLWTRFGLLLHKISNPIIMGLVFFLTVTPTAIIMRLLGKDPMRRKLDRDAKSYWIDRQPPGPPADTMTNQF